MRMSRRHLLKTGMLSTVTLGALSVTSRLPAFAADKPLTVIDWGGNYIDNIRLVSEKLTGFDVTYDVHAGDATATLTKMKTTWPKSDYDVVAAWNPIFSSMINEGWAETVTADEIPNLKDVPSALFMSDGSGAWKTVPRSIMALHWGYAKQFCPFPLTNIRDLLDPRLKGLVLMPPPQSSTNMQMISIAYALGGDERNMEPAWEFVKKMAEAGNIGRVSMSDADTFTSMSTGETCVTFTTSTGFQHIGTVTPVENLARMPADSGFRTGIVTEGWIVPKGANTAAAKEWLNGMMSPESNAAFCSAVGSIPANIKATVSEEQKYVAFTEEEYAKYTFPTDWAYVATQVDGWIQRWEKEIAPLL